MIRGGVIAALKQALPTIFWLLAAWLTPTASPAAGPCIPATLTHAGGAASARAPASAGPTQIYFDSSGSMAGYVAAAPAGVRPLGDVIEVLDHLMQATGRRTQYFAFGKAITPLANGVADARRYGTAAPYVCHGCDNQESHIDAVLSRIAQANSTGLSVVVTDLWLDNTSFIGSPQVALGQPLTEILKKGRSIGILGIRAPYHGRITDLPSGKAYLGATSHPLFVILIGANADVASAYAALTSSGSPALSKGSTRYALFSTQFGDRWASARGLNASGPDATKSSAIPPERLPGIQQFVIRPGVTMTSMRGSVSGTFDPGQAMDANAVWTGPLKASTHVWRLNDSGGLRPGACGRNTWVEIAPLQGAWRASKGGAVFSLTAASGAGLVPGSSYFVFGGLGVKSIQTPNPASRWMTDWSFAPNDEAALLKRRPDFFPTLSLGDLSSAMERATSEAAPSGFDTLSMAFVVSVTR